MTDLVDEINDEINREAVNPSQAVIEKYILEITRFPNGTTYCKSYPIGKLKYQGKKKNKEKKELPGVNVVCEEVL